jgi:hypothetical protein
LTFSFLVNASEKKLTKVTSELRSEILKFLGDKIPLYLKSPSTAEVIFMIDNQNELFVIFADSKSNEFNSFVIQ